MDFNKGIPTKGQSEKDLVESVDSCSICGHKLVYYHLTDFRENMVEEEGQCPSCGIKNKANRFVLH
jgi:DNA-directed RNA polymerase subunit RPC12/RpoP